MQLVAIELKKVYRQSDSVFINLLDHIRTSQVTNHDLQLLNQRIGMPPEQTSHMVITLSTHRDTVDFINSSCLAKLKGDLVMFYGLIEGEFPESSLPTPIELEVKVGAQILFIKNDREKRWVNGTLGTIIGLDDAEAGHIYVMLEDGEEVDVEQEIWSNVKYTFNETEKKVEEQEIGTYRQYPIRLAWAITVHKSQGLTFSHVKIDFTGGVFAGGQTYVALSRCTSLDGIYLQQAIRREDIFVKNEVRNFASTYNNNQLIHAALQQSKADKEYADAAAAYDKGDMQATLDNIFKAIHSRYDIEKPAAKRLLRLKLNKINIQKQEIDRLHAELEIQKQILRKLSVEYLAMGRECEHAGMKEAAVRNYEKALVLCPELPEAKRRLEKLGTKRGKATYKRSPRRS